MRTINIDLEKWSDQYEYIRSMEWSLENETLLAIVNLYFANHTINLQK